MRYIVTPSSSFNLPVKLICRGIEFAKEPFALPLLLVLNEKANNLLRFLNDGLTI